MPYQNFTEYPLWKEASLLTDSIFDFSRGIEDFPLRNRMTAAAVEIPFRLGEAAQSDSDETMKELLWKVEDPVNELRAVLTEAKEHGFAPGSDYELMQERCRDLFQKVHEEASSSIPLVQEEPVAPAEEPEPVQEPILGPAEEKIVVPVEEEKLEEKPPAPPKQPKPVKHDPIDDDDDELDENTLI
ncbi:four helix bundle protein [Puniceicoccus vermicola]|uniref:Four helix bundle protein n=1 Tax=Puniceicoccus vermicola TaxID=388746 RepID=A0A7X1AWT6_9BACT|nr:four helix bundle protein [Puniceicoccus vermicola]MBC2601292.1 four helix bundle protein [Puniceicoccus vermicola]